MAEEMFDAENVGIGKGNPNGYAWVAPKGTKLPVDAKEAIPDGFVSLGYVNDEGVVKQLAEMIPTFTPTRSNLKT